jgi:hypothetical protein
MRRILTFLALALITTLPIHAQQAPAPVLIAYSNDQSGVSVYRGATGETIALDNPEALPIIDFMEFSPTGDHLVIVTRNYEEFIIEGEPITPPAERRANLSIFTIPVGELNFTLPLIPAGARLSIDDEIPTDETNATIGDFAWSPDGAHLAFVRGSDQPLSEAGGVVTIVSLADGRIYSAGGRRAPFMLMWSPDSRALIYQNLFSLGTGAGISAGAINLFTLADETLIEAVPATDQSLVPVGWVSDTAFVYTRNDIVYGAAGLSFYDLAEGVSSPILPPEQFTLEITIALDPLTRDVFFTVPENTLELETGADFLPPGVYRYDHEAASVEQIQLTPVSAYPLADGVIGLGVDNVFFTQTGQVAPRVFGEYAPGGQSVIYYEEDSTLSLLRITTGETTPLPYEGVLAYWLDADTYALIDTGRAIINGAEVDLPGLSLEAEFPAFALTLERAA